MNEKTLIFKPEDIVVELGDKKYRLIYDLNAFCEMEKMYDSVDSVLQMLLGTSAAPDLQRVTYCEAPALAEDIKIADVPLSVYINKLNDVKQAKHTDTLNLLWIGCLHDHAVYNDFGEITGYTISKAKLGAEVTFKNLRDVNAKIIIAILRDLVPEQDAKNAEAPEEQQPAPLRLVKPE